MSKLTEKEQLALQEFTQIIRGKLGQRIKLMLLYGSKVRGDSRPDSDLDIFVLVDEENYKLRDLVVDVAFDLLLKHEVLISPRVISELEYQQLNRWQTSFIKNLHRDGIKIE